MRHTPVSPASPAGPRNRPSSARIRGAGAAVLALCWLCSGLAGAAPIVIDPGHSPAQPGALSCGGHYEHLFNGDLAVAVIRRLVSEGFAVLPTRDWEEELSLRERAALARGAALFVSLHHDSAQPQYLEPRGAGMCNDSLRGYSIFVSRKNGQFPRSLKAARAAGEVLRQRGLRPSTHHGEAVKGENRPCLDAHLGIYAFDDLVVLKHAAAPALLLEAAVIVNPEDEARALDPAYRAIIAEAVLAAARAAGAGARHGPPGR